MTFDSFLIFVAGATVFAGSIRLLAWFDERRWARERADEEAARKAAE